MPEDTPRTLNHFAFFAFTPAHAALPPEERRRFHQRLMPDLRSAAPHVDVYQVYPAQAGADLLIWSALPADDPAAPGGFFERFGRATTPSRHVMTPTQILWGFTRPSQYTKTRPAQEINPFASPRQPYLVVYPFVKTDEWYRLSREARQGMMNEHIKIGKSYPEITQLLLYSFGLQDQEFIVVYETADLAHFSDLVHALRASEARRFTERDTPLYTAFHRPERDPLEMWD